MLLKRLLGYLIRELSVFYDDGINMKSIIRRRQLKKIGLIIKDINYLIKNGYFKVI